MLVAAVPLILGLVTWTAPSVTGPWPNGDQFIVGFDFEVTFKPTGQRFPMKEMGLYTVQNGQVVHEAFFYAT